MTDVGGDGARADAVLARAPHIQTYMRGASAAGVGVGMHSHGPRQSPRHPPPARAIRLRPANHMRTQHRSTMPQAYGRLDRGLNSHHSLLLLPLRFCADARVHPPPHRPACALPRLHQRPVAAGSSCLHLFNSREATTDISQVRLRPPFGDGGGAESGCGCRF